MTQYVIDSTDVTPNGMEEVTGSIPVRSTNQTNNLDSLALGLWMFVSYPAVLVPGREKQCLRARPPSNVNHRSFPMTF
jgi:hypothetical protein